MKVQTLAVTAVAVILSKVATAEHTMSSITVKFGGRSSTRVEFRKRSDGKVELKSWTIDYCSTYVTMFTDLSTADDTTRHHITAACVAAGLDAFMVGYSTVVGLVGDTHHEEVKPVEREVVHASSWAPAQQYALSGYRKEEPQRDRNNERAETIGTLLGIGLSILANRR